MKIAYLVQTHRNPELLKRKIKILSSEDFAFFIHVDKKSDINNFSEICGDNVFFCRERVPVYWAEYSMVEAILILMRQALDGPQKYDYLILSTGSDYPLRHREYVHDYLERNRGKEFISSIKMTNEEGCLQIPQINTFRIQSSQPVSRLIMRIINQLHVVRRDYRKHLGNLEPYFGNAGWALTREACRYLLEFVENNPSFCDYFKKAFAPDEMFFHTILGNSVFKPRMSRHFTFEDWGDEAELLQNDGPWRRLFRRFSGRFGHPAQISEKHIRFFEANDQVIIKDIFGSAEMLFARKLSDSRIDLVLPIETMISRKKQTVNRPPGQHDDAPGQTFQTISPGLLHLTGPQNRA